MRLAPGRAAKRTGDAAAGRTSTAPSASGRITPHRACVEADPDPRTALCGRGRGATAKRRAVRLHAAAGGLEDYLTCSAAIEAAAAKFEASGRARRLPAAARSAPEAAAGHARPGRDRGQHPPGAQLGRAGRAHRVPLRAAFEAPVAEKFMLDGRHTGTGGGNHFVLGGATPATARSCAARPAGAAWSLYWHNHPSLSYLFSGLFIGPTSRRRASTRRATTSSTNSKSRWTRSRADPRPAWPGAALAGRPPAAQPPDRRHRQHPPQQPSSASTSCTRPTARPGAWACWSCARSRCRRMRA